MTLRSLNRTFRRVLVGTLAATRGEFIVTDRPALIIAPHPDDEVFGTGGLILSKREAGARVCILFLTGGGASHSLCCGVHPSEVIKARRSLALRAAEALSVSKEDCIFLDLPDGMLPTKHEADFDEAVNCVLKVLSCAKPQEVYVTHPGEVWADHCAAADIATEACRRYSASIMLWFYLVWAPLNQSVPGLLRFRWRLATRLSIAKYMNRKQEAISLYLKGEPSTSCGRPWVGVLPRDFLRIHEWPCEVLFRSL